jgi:HPt (histidine-containing phosphotransfer) domain-containing protein
MGFQRPECHSATPVGFLAPPLSPSFAEPHVLHSEFANIPQVRRLLPGYVAGLPRDVGLMIRALSKGRRQDLRRVAHQLRGSGGAYGFPEITRLASIVESAIDAARPLEDVADNVLAIINTVRNVEGYDRSAEIPTEPSEAAL